MVEIPEEAIEEKFLAATGPGGQNVNKVATACQLRADVFKLGLAPDVYARLKQLAGDAHRDALVFAMGPALHWTPAGLHATRLFAAGTLP